MTNALNFFGTKGLFDFSSMPIFDAWDNMFVPSCFTNSPKVNVKETDKAYEIEIANPGFNKDDTEIKIEDHVIYVSMKLETESKDENKYHIRQWKKSSYEESWNIPDNVIEEEISATHNDGILTITLPKKAEDSTKNKNLRTIEIK